jgi:molybdenum cofactor cytidylyltransferase
VRTSCGVVLAGGRGERYGGPKAQASLPDGRSFLVACRDLLADGGCRRIVATVPPGSDAAGWSGLLAVPLLEPGLTMFDSLRAALTVAVGLDGWEVAIVLPVDHPLVRPATVRALVSAGGAAAVPVFAGKHGHPVAIDHRTANGILAGDLPGPTLREVLRECGARDVPVDDPGVRANCNTPEALESAWRALRAAG